MPRKKIQPLFEEPIKKPAEVKKSTTKAVVDKKETIVPKSKTSKKEEPVKPLAKETPKAVVKKPVVKPPIKKEVSKPLPKKEPKKVLPKESPKPIKVNPPKVKKVEIEIPEEEQIEIEEEKKPAYVKESKRKPKVDKNDPPVNKKHTLKVGTRVIVTFLGQPEPGTIIELTAEGMYKVKADRGIILPRAKYEGGEIIDKRYPSYIIKVIK
jgi:hypothetical protein